MKKSFILLLWVLGFAFLGTGIAQENQIIKGKIYQDTWSLVSESDYYCSIFVMDTPLPELKITGAERQDEKMLLSDSDKFFINKGQADGLEIGQLFVAIELGPKIQNYGHLATRTGRARIMELEDHKGVLRVEKTCGTITVGSCLVPFVEREEIMGKDEGYSQSLDESQGIKGSVIYFDTDTRMGGRGYRGIIDLGLDDGLKVGQQITVFKKMESKAPREAIGNLLVIDVQKKTSTFKVLSSRDSVDVGAQVQTR